MFDSAFWIKYFFRVIHIFSLVAVCHSVINAKITGQLSKEYSSLYAVTGILAMVSGYINSLLLKAKDGKDMGNKRKLWVGFHHIKLLSGAILFSPIHNLLIKNLETKIDLQFYWIILALLASPFARFYRQYYAEKGKELRQKISEDGSNSAVTP